MAEFKDFLKLDIKIGTIIKAEEFKKAKKKAYKLEIDFGSKIGIKKSSAQITEKYQVEDLINKQIVAIINFPPKQIANFISDVLVLGIYTNDGVVLLSPDKIVENGTTVG